VYGEHLVILLNMIRHGILEYSKDIQWNLFTATGGTITYLDDYAIHTFLNSGAFHTLSLMGDVSVLIVGPGGKGSGGTNTYSDHNSGGGGGGGKVIETSITLSANTSYDVSVGLNNTGQVISQPKMNWSKFGTICASGGFPSYWSTGGSNNKAGGASGNNFAGGSGNTTRLTAGGGGGDSSVGKDGMSSSPDYSGNGGEGIYSSISGITIGYGGGGGGGNRNNPVGTNSYGGGSGGNKINGFDASANTGGGGGGGGANDPATNGGLGADGIVIIKYKYKIRT
jgi:hypothetical protein